MAIEVELKFLDVDHSSLRDRLRTVRAKRISGYFEKNIVLDDLGRTLYKRSALLRLRQAGKTTMTVKRIPTLISDESKVKVYEEYQSEITNYDEMISCLHILGYDPVFRYEKFREKWEFMDCLICVDTLPFGNYVEIEGTEQNILNCALELGLDIKSSSKKTYHELNRENRVRLGLEPDENFVFTAEQCSHLPQGI